MPKLLNAYLPPILWAGFIFFLSSQTVLPGLEVNTWDFVFKKSAHMFVYAVLYLLIHRALLLTTFSSKLSSTQSIRLLTIPLILTLLYAISDEIHQTFIPGRYGTIRDILFDLLGGSVAILYRYRYI